MMQFLKKNKKKSKLVQLKRNYQPDAILIKKH